MYLTKKFLNLLKTSGKVGKAILKKDFESCSRILAEKGIFVFSNDKKLLSLRDTQKGKTAFLIGSGPSVRLGDLNKISENNNIVSFCCNRFFLSYEKHKLRPDFTVSADKQILEDHSEEIEDNSTGIVFFGNPRRNSFRRAIWVPVFWDYDFKFSKSPFPGIYPGGGSLIFALQLGYFMGIRKFYLYGVDHNFKAPEAATSDGKVIGEGNHFISNYRSGKSWYPPWVEVIEKSFSECDWILKQEKGFVKNATHGGCLDVLERVSFDTIFTDQIYLS
jgi:hypothetical protein